LYFYATWCPSCRAEQRFVQGAFDNLNDPNLVGFRVNWNDPETDDFEKELAREYGVGTQSTKILIRDGEIVQKTPRHFEAEEYDEFFGVY
jgi:thiol-disulfide isomerase/thioredoxin